ncbi:MAG: AAA family ATPase [Bradymonadaceae bacterium]
MLLEALRLRHFRNLSAVDLTPHPRFNILTGPNGQGKTNLLEAVFLLSAVKSFRSSTTNVSLVEFGQDEALLEGKVDRGGRHD